MFLPAFSSRKRFYSEVLRHQQPLMTATDASLRAASLNLRGLAQSGKCLKQLMPEAFALVREAARRVFGYCHHDVQLLGGMHMALRRVIEMETGQGKTLTAILPLYLFALQGKGAHLATSNDYLARRDAETMEPVFSLLGIRCGYVVDQMPDDERRTAYACDITYGTGTEFGFDFLRDRIKRRNARRGGGPRERCVQRGLHFILADEADALLVDDANTPMVMGTAGEKEPTREELYRWLVSIAPLAREGRDFIVKSGNRPLEITSQGRLWIRNRLRQAGIDLVISPFELYDGLQKSLTVLRNFHRDKQYIIRDQEVVLVNEQTGRLGEGRQLQNGLHQMIQANEGLPLTAPNSHAARVTVQSFFLSYDHLAGMSGTVLCSAREFRKVYKRSVVRVPTAVPSRRESWPTRVCITEAARWQSVCDEVEQLLRLQRSVLIGTRSVEKSEALSQQLQQRGIRHTVLNARLHAEEAEIIARAGEPGAVTVATGMAGRGTDIKLSECVRRAGGLHVVLTELHDSSRADQQLFGRCGRQGDPGSYRQFLSADDEVLQAAYGHEVANRLRERLTARNIESAMRGAQRALETRQELARAAQLHAEERKLKSLRELGLDPILDVLA
jgi:preprotein translocase subunit SecA